MTPIPPGAGDDRGEAILQRRAEQLAAPVSTDVDVGEAHLVVRAAGRRLGIPAHRVRHVSETPVITPLAGMPPAIVGMAAVLGELVAVADLTVILDPAASPTRRGHLVAVDDGGEMLGMLVDALEDLQPIDLTGATPDVPTADGLLQSTAGDVLLIHLDTLLTDPRLAPTTDRRPHTAEGKP